MAAVKELAKDGKPLIFDVTKGTFFDELGPRLTRLKGVVIAVVCEKGRCEENGRCERFMETLEKAVKAFGGNVAMGVLPTNAHPEVELFIRRALGCTTPSAIFIPGQPGADVLSRALTLAYRGDLAVVGPWLQRCFMSIRN